VTYHPRKTFAAAVTTLIIYTDLIYRVSWCINGTQVTCLVLFFQVFHKNRRQYTVLFGNSWCPVLYIHF
jgi:hypothetical protein